MGSGFNSASSKCLRSPIQHDSKDLFATTFVVDGKSDGRAQLALPHPRFWLVGATELSKIHRKRMIHLRQSPTKIDEPPSREDSPFLMQKGNGSQLRTEGKYRRVIDPSSRANEEKWENTPYPHRLGWEAGFSKAQNSSPALAVGGGPPYNNSRPYYFVRARGSQD